MGDKIFTERIVAKLVIAPRGLFGKVNMEEIKQKNREVISRELRELHDIHLNCMMRMQDIVNNQRSLIVVWNRMNC